jgi:hypothetical protein
MTVGTEEPQAVETAPEVEPDESAPDPDAAETPSAAPDAPEDVEDATESEAPQAQPEAASSADLGMIPNPARAYDPFAPHFIPGGN